MAASFDPEDKASWYFGRISRPEATEILSGEKEGGIFLVRDSTSIAGDYVLCVREDNKVSHYIINKMQQNEQVRYRIGDQIFPNLPSLLNFYKIHYLDTTPLVRPVTKKCEKVIAKYDFEGNDPDDLPFKKGEILSIVTKDEEQWWTAKNSNGQVGSIPVPYIQKCDDGDNIGVSVQIKSPEGNHTDNQSRPKSGLQRKLPAYARVKQARQPNAYDKTALRLEVGDLIKVTKMNINGQWEGELNGKVGHFPFTHIEFMDTENIDGSDTN